METRREVCAKCRKPRTVIPGHEDRDVHPLCDSDDTWWWEPGKQQAGLDQLTGGTDG